MITIKDLSINIGEFALRDLNLTIRDREYFIILGPSGAGKTVFMECLAGIHRVRKGFFLSSTWRGTSSLD
jgi:ABC-type sugar transport system ATPase subunit